MAAKARRTSQIPLPGIGGVVRYTRSASAITGRRDPGPPPWLPGVAPMSWQTVVDPESVILHVWVPGEPQSWERVVPAALKERADGSQYLRRAFVPRPTQEAKATWKGLMMLARRFGPVEGPVGMRADFFTRLRAGQDKDWDNFGKLVSDAGNGILYVDDAQVVDPYCPVHRLAKVDVGQAGTNLLVWRL